MKMNRRNALLGLGAIATGGGALFGSGAFSQVEAGRSFSVETTGDGSAFLQLNAENTTYAGTNNGTLAINLDSSSGSSGTGLNYEAVTTLDTVFSVGNEGSDPIDVYVSAVSQSSGYTTSLVQSGSGADNYIEIDDGSGNTVEITIYNEDNSNNSIVDSSSTGLTSFGTGSTANIGIEVDTTGFDSSNDSGALLDQITITASTP